ncbi:MAG: hypothetical protein PSV13_10010, partial [Lacunisphaera sp.]|nr:hypothetical protein [Lacunisphaera sp.]
MRIIAAMLFRHYRILLFCAVCACSANAGTVTNEAPAEVGLRELTPGTLRPVWARMLAHWQDHLNAEGTMGPDGDYQWSLRMFWPLAGWFSQP